ncbi:MAG: Hpt domain-containing protein [Candidatus Thiodiazotropha weberae]|nr:Hpt domain-containing protein [Candidatus Thiodiazotropha lotti]MCG8022007.1 Hpt domain-containing protein [Candidatus Thiodiazotropha lotti]MCW4209180.1 Hpt domain-containing protein [Candidatus Thiodiazotropha lotti]MCW4214440.1 Hpt domain-containing protein [Candidatus Thiodiazotropha lotti]
MSNAQDFGALNWVKDELDVSIRHARQALESYVETPGDNESLATCGDHLHQIARVLQMVQVYGPSMLAEEMELVVRDMSEGIVRQEEDAAEALMLALIQLPDYLEKLQGGDADIPLIILPLLNDLRAVRDAPLLSEAALFKPEIDTESSADEVNKDLPALVRQVRQKFHLGLLSWYRKRDTVHGWPLLRDVFTTIHKSAGTESVQHLFWVAEGLMHGLIDNTIAPGIAVKQLFSRLDRKMKIIIDNGEQSLVDEPPSALLKNLLYYIARSNSQDPLILEIKQAYNLDAVMPSEDQLNQGRLGLTGSNAELAESIKDAVSSELTRIKDILDLFMRDEKADMEMLGHLEAPTRKLADTLGMIGQGALRSRLNRQADKVKTFVEQGVLPEEFELMEMAGDILYVESSLSTLHTFQPGAAETIDENTLGDSLPEGEYQNLIKQTVREAKVEIARAKETIISFTEATDDTSVLEPVRQGFRRVEGALQMLNLREAAELMSQTGAIIKNQLIEASAPPNRQQLNSLADVVSSIEYYLETLVDGAGDRREILAIAQASLNDLMSDGKAEVNEYVEPVEPINLDESADHAEGYDLEEEEISDLEFGASSLQIEPPQPEVEILASTEDTSESESKAEPEPFQDEEIAAADKPMLEDIDPEILEIFIEEAREELENIQTYLPRWQHDQADRDALTIFRRSFHTLKGSGRLVGAKVIGELAWSVENMLNRLIDETIKVSPEMMELLNQVTEALPILIESQEQGVSPAVDVELLQCHAHALSEGRPIEQPAEPVVSEAQQQPADSTAATEDEFEVEALETAAEEIESEVEDLPAETAEREAGEEDATALDVASLDEPEVQQPPEVSDDEVAALGEAMLEGTSVAEAEAEFTDSDLEIEIDTELLEVFAEESEEHLQEIEIFLKQAKGISPPMLLPEEVVRACHTLHGSAHMAGITPIAMLSEAMEDYVRAVHENQIPAESKVVDLVDGSVGYIRQLLELLPDENLPEPHVETFLQGLNEALQEIEESEEDVAEAEPLMTEEGISEEEAITPDEASALEEELQIEAIEEIGLTDEESIDLASDLILEELEANEIDSGLLAQEKGQDSGFYESTSYLQSTDYFDVEGDEELLEIFIEEGRELLEALEQGYNDWQKSLNDETVVDGIKRTLHTLKGSSRLAGINPIGDLSHALEDLFESLLRENKTADQRVQDLVRQAFDFLATQVEDAATVSRVPVSTQLLTDLEHPFTSVETSEAEEEAEALHDEVLEAELQLADEAFPDAELEIEPADQEEDEHLQELELQSALEEVVEEQDPSELDSSEALDASSYYAEPMSFLHEGDLFEVSEDRELVDIFVEESKELLESLEEQFQKWANEPSDHQHLDAILRALHTVKGSSRLAGIEPVGDLSHAMESLLNGVIRGHIPADDQVMGLSRSTLDLLATQTDDAETSNQVHRADSLIAEIQTLIDKGIEEEGEVEDLIDPDLKEELEELEELQQQQAEEAVEAESEPAPQQDVEDLDDIQIDASELDVDVEDVSEEALMQPDESFLMMHDEVLLDVGEDEELIQIFIEEAKEFMEEVEARFLQWLDKLDDQEAIDGMQRNLHTLKGSARLAGIMPIGDLSHAVESVMTALAEGEIDPIDPVTEALRHSIDHLAFQVDTIAKTGKVPASDVQVEQLHNLLGGEMPPAHGDMVETIQEVSESSILAEEPEPEQPTAQVLPFNEEIAKLLNPEQEQEKEKAGFKPNKEQVRVNADLMDRLVNHAGEVSIYRARLEQQNSVLGFNLSELEQTVSRLYTQLRNLEIETEAQILYRWERETEKEDQGRTEFDPLELDRFSTMQQLSRALVETVNDLGNINESLRDLQRETDTLLLQQSRISTDLQDGLLRTRMVPFATLVPRMQRLVRQTAGQLNKKANLECFGIEGELDRSILNRMVPVLEHLLRNSVSHGIEPPDQRLADGKQGTGRISLYLDREATDVLITLSDDGKGLDIEAIRKRALEQGMINADVEISDDDLIQCVLLPGFSTAKEVTQISGRGVGLDVVTSEVKQLGGSLEIDSQPGRGTSFIIRLPLTLAITDALLIRTGEEIYAIPHGSISGVVRIRRDEILRCYEGKQESFDYGGKQYKVSYLGRMMGTGQHEIHEGMRWLPLLLLQTGEHQVALQVDDLLGSRQVVVKNLGKQVGSVRWITGGTILADGRVALILDLAALVRMDATHAAPIMRPETEQKKLEERLRVMVVDDSITVRKVTSRLLERHDMDVVTAKDGVEAVALLQEQVPDIMLLDIEMPRMDGFELARHINNSVDYYGLPIIMISSRVGDKHRQRAMDLGVKRCLGKPYQESELLENINEVLTENRQ